MPISAIVLIVKSGEFWLKMMGTVMRRISQVPFLRDIKEAIERRLYNDAAWMLYSDLYPQLEMYAPFSAGSHRDLVRLAFLSVEQTFPLLQTFVEETRSERTPVMDIEAFCTTNDEDLHRRGPEAPVRLPRQRQGQSP